MSENKNKNEFDVFISYQWSSKPKVILLHENLNKEGYKVWRDDSNIEINNIGLKEQLANAIKSSKIILCCLNKEYCQSENCIKEINYSSSIRKNLIILYLERLNMEEIGGIGFLISDLIRINCYKHPDTWFNDDFIQIKSSIQNILNNIKKENNIGNDKILNDRYEKIKVLGKGGFSVVYLVKDLKEEKNSELALKEFHPFLESEETNFKMVLREVNLLKQVKHRNLIEYIDFFKEKETMRGNEYLFCYIITKYYKDGTLNDEIAMHKLNEIDININDIINWSMQLISAIKFLHCDNSEKIIHRDIKPANIFLSERTLILGDLGLAKISNADTNSSKSNIVGTASYIAPELLNQTNNYDEKIDIWAFGCIIYELIKLEKLFPKGLSNDIIGNFDLNKKEIISNLNKNVLINYIVEKCLVIKPEERINTENLYYSIWNFDIRESFNRPLSALKTTVSTKPDIKQKNELRTKINDITCVKTLTGHYDCVFCLQLLNNGLLASGCRDNTIKIWDLNNYTCIQTLKEHKGWVSCFQLIDKNYLASGSNDKTIKIWDLNNYNCIQTLNGHNNCVYTLSLINKNCLASGSWDNTIKIWDLNNYTCIQTINEYTKWVRCIYLINENNLASSGDDKSIKIWDLKNFTCIQTLNGHSDYVSSLQLIDQNYLASGSLDKKIKIWDLNNYTCFQTLNGHDNCVSCLLLIDGFLASCSWDKTIKIWDLKNYTCIKTLNGHKMMCMK